LQLDEGLDLLGLLLLGLGVCFFRCVRSASIPGRHPDKVRGEAIDDAVEIGFDGNTYGVA
jgi:hypothetical protein